jgi:two-component system LytT family response regulator
MHRDGAKGSRRPVKETAEMALAEPKTAAAASWGTGSTAARTAAGTAVSSDEGLRALIADDVEASRRRIGSILGSRSGVRVVAECSDGLQAVDAIVRLRPDVAFLNVRLPRLDGFEVCARLGELRPHIVFISTTSDDAARAYELPAIDYLLKPFDDHRLLAAVERVVRAKAARPSMPAEELRMLLREIRGGKIAHLAVRSHRAILLLPVHDINWLEGHNNSVRIHVAGRTHLVRGTLNEMETRLPADRFMRVHRGAIVNLARVEEVVPWLHGDFRLVLYDRSVVPLGRRYHKGFEERLRIERLKVEP